jgi:outer membrane protein OmpA-like peptidoglycan-associated protein
MKASYRPGRYEESSVLTNGVVDLMTSLAVIFILLFAASIARVDTGTTEPVPGRATPAENETIGDVRASTPESRGPNILTITVPDAALRFDFGKSALLPLSETILVESIPQYASMICGPEGQDVEAFVIEGYTDDLGDDVHNLRLSQERSFAVLAKSLDIVRDRLPWAYECFLQKAVANGRGRQDLLRNETGYPDRNKSRRVVFKIHKHQSLSPY